MSFCSASLIDLRSGATSRRLAAASCRPVSDQRGPADYKRHLAYELTIRSLRRAWQRAVQQSAKGHFVWVINKDNQAELRPVVVGDWYGDSWFIAQGLNSGDQVIVDGTLRLAPGAPVKASAYVPPPSAAATTPSHSSSRNCPRPIPTRKNALCRSCRRQTPSRGVRLATVSGRRGCSTWRSGC